jgi:hypothetical protein
LWQVLAPWACGCAYIVEVPRYPECWSPSICATCEV